MLSLFQIFLIASVAYLSCASTLRGAGVDDLDLDLSLSEGSLRTVEEDATENEFKSLNILTLGGSVTWGASIEPRHHAYPFLLQNYDGHKVTNLGQFLIRSCIYRFATQFIYVTHLTNGISRLHCYLIRNLSTTSHWCFISCPMYLFDVKGKR